MNHSQTVLWSPAEWVQKSRPRQGEVLFWVWIQAQFIFPENRLWLAAPLSFAIVTVHLLGEWFLSLPGLSIVTVQMELKEETDQHGHRPTGTVKVAQLHRCRICGCGSLCLERAPGGDDLAKLALESSGRSGIQAPVALASAMLQPSVSLRRAAGSHPPPWGSSLGWTRGAVFVGQGSRAHGG